MFFKKKNKPTSRHGQPCVTVKYNTTNCIAHQYTSLHIPTITFQDIFGMTGVKGEVAAAVKEITTEWRAGSFKRNGILLYGDPGNGKTMFAEAIAGSCNVPYFELKASNVISQYIGETPRAIKESFDFIKRNAPCVLMMDEIDSFISTLNKNSTDDKRDIRNTLLTELVDIRYFPIFVVAATNYYDRLDTAAIREGRFDYKIEIKSPDQVARIALIKKNTTSKIDETLITAVAKRYAGFSVKRVISIAEGAQKQAGSEPLSIQHFSASLRKLQGSSGDALKDVPGLGELIFNTSLQTEVNYLVEELLSVDKLILAGSAPFKGALFTGPAGTGKTSLAKAIAKDSGWAFLSIAAPDILQDLEKLEKIYKKALELRPCVIFIDEATDLLKNRLASNYSSHTNKLLTIIDGFGESVPDVVFIAGTNHSDDVDEAVARRLYREIVFELPNIDSRVKLIAGWGRKNKQASSVISQRLDDIAIRLDGYSASKIHSWLDTQYKKALLDGIRGAREPIFESYF